MGHGSLVVGSIILEFLDEFLQLEENYFGFIVKMISKEGNIINDVVDDSFELFSWVN